MVSRFNDTLGKLQAKSFKKKSQTAEEVAGQLKNAREIDGASEVCENEELHKTIHKAAITRLTAAMVKAFLKAGEGRDRIATRSANSDKASCSAWRRLAVSPSWMRVCTSWARP